MRYRERIEIVNVFLCFFLKWVKSPEYDYGEYQGQEILIDIATIPPVDEKMQKGTKDWKSSKRVEE